MIVRRGERERMRGRNGGEAERRRRGTRGERLRQLGGGVLCFY